MTTLASLSTTQRAALVAAKPNSDPASTRIVLYRGRLNLEYGYVPVSTLCALEKAGLVRLVRVTTDVYSRSGLYYKGKRTSVDHAELTDAGKAARATLLANQ